MKNGINAVVHGELKRLMGEIIQISIPGINFNPLGTLKEYNSETGRVVLQRPRTHINVPVSTMCVDASTIVAVGHYTGYPK